MSVPERIAYIIMQHCDYEFRPVVSLVSKSFRNALENLTFIVGFSHPLSNHPNSRLATYTDGHRSQGYKVGSIIHHTVYKALSFAPYAQIDLRLPSWGIVSKG